MNSISKKPHLCEGLLAELNATEFLKFKIHHPKFKFRILFHKPKTSIRKSELTPKIS